MYCYLVPRLWPSEEEVGFQLERMGLRRGLGMVSSWCVHQAFIECLPGLRDTKQGKMYLLLAGAVEVR